MWFVFRYMDPKEYEFTARSEDCVSEMREFLDRLPVGWDDVTGIKVKIEADVNDAQQLLPEQQTTLDTIKEDVEYGPIDTDYPGDTTGAAGGGTPDNTWRVEGGVAPGTVHAEVLEAIDGKWMTSREVHEYLLENGQRDEYNYRTVAGHLSTDITRHSYVKRRGDDVPYEYSLDNDGKEALRFGRQQYEEKLEDEEVLESEG